MCSVYMFKVFMLLLEGSVRSHEVCADGCTAVAQIQLLGFTKPHSSIPLNLMVLKRLFFKIYYDKCIIKVLLSYKLLNTERSSFVFKDPD